MLHYLFDLLADDFSALNVFGYITLRTALAALTALMVSLLLGPALIRRLSRLRAGQPIREIGPDHQHKEGTPTMGGLLILLSLFISVLLWADLANRATWLVLATTFVYGVIGFMDDYLKVSRAHNTGLSVKAKLALQCVPALGLALLIVTSPNFDGEIQVPFFKDFTPYIGLWYVLPAALVIVAAANSVNLTDGLDGLAIGPVMLAAGAFAAFSYAAGHAVIADYLAVKAVPGSGELAIFCSALVGGSMGFLWFNTSPAQLFMGDVGALSLGAALGALAVLIRQEILLMVVGGIFVVEALSVMIQVAWFKLTGKRVFLMAPIHHHFEKLGWAEQKIVVRFWIVSAVLALISLSTLKLR